ncbi:MAG: 1-deoxy-D-xylulose-5-phosphate synthase [Bacteroidetes bacterium]|nr:1-deoxy-D-xylulose-5-phosphate synthase [Bacteroidota bacterium]MCL6100892.1 1-deoxy-D-xylulose-5-phosphate synthase [Bacteroidota bacterium]
MANLLENIDYPSDLKKIKEKDLPKVCAELRELIIREASCNPGHFGASMGVVELTVALHYVYNTPYDKLIWDVGHQAYSHKILTGRRNQFHTNRRYKGISGFPKRSESEYDAFGVGHSSTSISAALGISIAAELNGEKNRKVIAVIGDGSMTGGMAFEGLNNAGDTNADILVILNDNNMSIDPNVGSLSRYFVGMQTSKAYNRLRSGVWKILKHFRKVGRKTISLIQKHQQAVKSMVFGDSNLFEALGFRYFGPVDGHDVVALTRIFNDLKEIPGPKLLHVLTKKGKGFTPAENDATKWHAPGKFDAVTGEIYNDPDTLPKAPKYQVVFGKTLLELARINKNIVGVTPAMPSGCSMNIMMEEMPERAFDVGIAEPHAVTFAAGMAVSGKLPFVNIYSSFMQRSYDQIIHDVALQKLNVVFCLDRSGLVGADGATHHGVFDLSFMRNIPNMTVSAPMDELELRNLMFTAQLPDKGPFSIRYPRGIGIHKEWETKFTEIPVGRGRKIAEGEDVVILSIGHPGNFVIEARKILASENISVAHFDMRFLKPIDTEILEEAATRFDHIITVEDGMIDGGFGSAVLEYFSTRGWKKSVVRLGIPDRFVEQGTQQELYRECGFDVEGICKAVRKILIGKCENVKM